MYPILPFLNRECNTDWKIPETNMIIEKGTFVFIPVHALQMDPKYYPEPEKFLPERFASKRSNDRPYLPFGDGPRNCIGLRLGKMQTKVGLILMLKNNSYLLSGNTEKPINISPKSVLLATIGGMEFKVIKREFKEIL